MAVIEDRGFGRYRVKIRMKGFKPISQTFGTKQEAQLWANITETDMKNERHRIACARAPQEKRSEYEI